MRCSGSDIGRLAVFVVGALLLVPALGLAQEEVALPSLETPRDTIRTFFEAMSAVEAGNEARRGEALECLYLDEELGEEERLDVGAQAAHELYEVLNSIQFKLSEVAEEVSGADYVAQLGPEEQRIELRLHRYEQDGKWRFSSRTLKSSALEDLKETVVDEPAEMEAEGPGYVENLASVRAAMQTFLRGMNETDGLTHADAVTVLDLSDVNEAVRQEKGLELAYELKTVIDRVKYVEYPALPPESDRVEFAFFRDPAGNIVLDVVEDPESGEKAWKFTKGTLESLEALYLKYKDRPLIKGVKAREGQGVPLGIQVRDWMYDNFPFLVKESIYLQNWQWIGLFTVIIIGMAVSRAFAFVLLGAIRHWFRRERYTLDAKLEKDFVRPIRVALMAWFWLLGLKVLGLPGEVLAYLRIAAIVITAAGVVWALYRLIDIAGEYLRGRAARTDNKFDDLLVPIVVRSLKIFMVVVAIVLVAEYNQWDLKTLLAGLGLGGLAFALAAKDVVANVFGSFTILLDRPFQIGDWVTIGSIDGNVESVGIRSTRIRTFYNSLITVPNSELITTSVDNMGARRYRRIKTMIGIAYDTPPEKVEAFCEGIRELIRRHPYTRKDYYHCYLNQFSASSLDVLLYCFVETPEWGTELRERHRLFVDIIRLAKRLGIEFAFPTHTLYMREDRQPHHESPTSPDEGFRLGRQEAQDIVRTFVGDGVVPPPVTYDAPQGADEELRLQRGEEAGEGEE